MKICDSTFEIPIELSGDDVYDMLYIFDTEEEAVNYIANEYPIDVDEFVSLLHEEDMLREEYGKENYLRSASISISLHLKELMNGQYLLWESY